MEDSPSPREVEEFKVEKIPHIIIFNTDGKELGKIIENPAQDKTLEEEILQRVKKRLAEAGTNCVEPRRRR